MTWRRRVAAAQHRRARSALQNNIKRTSQATKRILLQSRKGKIWKVKQVVRRRWPHCTEHPFLQESDPFDLPPNPFWKREDGEDEDDDDDDDDDDERRGEDEENEEEDDDPEEQEMHVDAEESPDEESEDVKDDENENEEDATNNVAKPAPVVAPENSGESTSFVKNNLKLNFNA